MEMNTPTSRRNTGLTALVMCLSVLALVLGMLLYLTLEAVPTIPSPRRTGMLRLAWMSLTALSVTLILLVWAVIRAVALNLRPQHHEKTPYVDAWSLAGQRMDASDHEDQDGPENETGNDEDGGGDDRFKPNK